MSKQLEFKYWGGRRKGAGRPNLSGLPQHGTRDKVDLKKPLHITMRLKKGVVNIRTKEILKGFKSSMKKAKEFGLYINHYSLLSNHVHIIVEAKDNKSLERGMKSLAGRFGKFLSQGSGSVFYGRYHLHVLRTPREMKNALEYVLLNLAKHRKLIAYIDTFSSAKYFGKWKFLIKRPEPLLDDLPPRNDLPPELAPFQSWMGREGWLKVL